MKVKEILDKPEKWIKGSYRDPAAIGDADLIVRKRVVKKDSL